MFERIFVENEVRDHPRVSAVLGRFDRAPVTYVERVEDVFGAVEKPYLLKRTDLNLLLGAKKGNKLRPSPQSYGAPARPHFCLTHLYNCAYECVYCYLQGYFHSPDMVFHVNLEAFARKMEQVARDAPAGRGPWFHAGEYGDSLALAHVTGEIPLFFQTLARLPEATLELRTKSANIEPLLQMAPVPNAITSFTLTPQSLKERYEPTTPPVRARIAAMATLAQKGYPLAAHLDPLIYEDSFEEDYQKLVQALASAVDLNALSYVTTGALRFSKRAFHRIKNNYPRTHLLAADFATGSDGKVRYKRPMRLWMLNRVKKLLTKAGLAPERIYTCMETGE